MSDDQDSVRIVFARDSEWKGHKEREGGREGVNEAAEKKESNGRLLLILPYLSLFAETPFVFQVPVIRV